MLFDQLECSPRWYYCESVDNSERMDQNNCINEDSSGDESRKWAINDNDDTNMTSIFS